MLDTVHPSWHEPLRGAFGSAWMAELRAFLAAEKHAGETVLPAESEWFAALGETPRDDVRVVILGQDPYHGAGQAHGLAFSVRPGVRVPPSLLNIYKEMESDLGVPRAAHGDLRHWARQGPRAAG